jgi:hypothetical protein
LHKLHAGLITGILCCGIAFWAAGRLKESFHTDLDYHEKRS